MDGSTPAARYGLRSLRLRREEMIRGDSARRPWSRPYINQQVTRMRRMLKWAVSCELVSAGALQALATVEPLRRGRIDAREPKRVLLAPMEK